MSSKADDLRKYTKESKTSKQYKKIKTNKKMNGKLMSYEEEPMPNAMVKISLPSVRLDIQ